jgi:hypothetical protein
VPINGTGVGTIGRCIQQEIRSKVKTSHQKREQSKQLLEIAKIGVERAITYGRLHQRNE